MAEKFVFREVEFRAGAHLWSNPKLRGTHAEIPIILARPTLFDVVKLAQHYSLEALHLANRRLRVSREISERQHLRTDAILRNIDRINAGHPATIEEVVRAIETDDDLPVPVDPIPTAALQQEIQRLVLRCVYRPAHAEAAGKVASRHSWRHRYHAAPGTLPWPPLQTQRCARAAPARSPAPHRSALHWWSCRA